MDVQRETFITVPALYIYRYVVGERGRLGNVNPILGVLCPNTVARKFRYVLLPRIINYAKTELNWDPPLGGSRRAPLLPPSSSNVRRTELGNKRVSLNSLSFFEGGGRVRRGRTLRESGRVLNWGNEGFEGEGMFEKRKARGTGRCPRRTSQRREYLTRPSQN